jgi:hypothetical protein
VFCYTSWCFYAFSGTNLLTRCHSASFLFFVVLCFRKVTQEIFSELDETKAEPPIFTEPSRRPKMRRRGGRSQAHDQGARHMLGAKFLVVLCEGFMLLLVKSNTPTSSLSGAIVWSVTKLASITFLSLAFSYWFDSTLVSQLMEDLLLCSSYLLLGFPTGRSSISTPHHQQVFWRRCRGGRRLLQGESRTHNLLLYFCFALFYFCLYRFIKNTKKISFLYSCYFITLSSLCCSLSMFWRTSQ